MDTKHLKIVFLALFDEKGDDIYDFLYRYGIECREVEAMMERFAGAY